MLKKDRNKQIVALIRSKLNDAGISDRLDVFPLDNTCLRRTLYWNDGEKNIFKVHMWDVNSLSEQECENEIDRRIEAARRYFGI